MKQSFASTHAKEIIRLQNEKNKRRIKQVKPSINF